MPPVILKGDGARPDDLFQACTWPGVPAVESCVYTCSHGASPGVATLVTIPQPTGTDRPQEFGDLVFSDGRRSVAVRDCKVDSLTSQQGPNGVTWLIRIFDRRWKWRTPTADYGAVSGAYNLTEVMGKLTPWTIRSPEEMARLCLDAMGETNYLIDLPKGLEKKDGADLDRYLRAGENFPPSLANPEMVWDYTPPHLALQRLCDFFGRRLVFQPVANRVVIAPQGVGKEPAPNAPYEASSPGLDAPETPAAVGVAGARTRFQARFLLEPVGEEWDGSYLPIDRLSYAPRGFGATPQKSTITSMDPDATPPVPSTATAAGLTFYISWTDPKTGEDKQISASSSALGLTAADRWGELIPQLQNSPDGATLFTYSTTSTALTVAAKDPALTFSIGFVLTNGPTAAYQISTTQPAGEYGGSWRYCPPPLFAYVRATDRLSYSEALQLARKSVFRCYRLRNVDPWSRQPPLKIPGYGEIKRRQQIVWQPTKVEQVVPQPRVAGGRDKDNLLEVGLNQGILPEFYTGYSRDQRATVRGSVWKLIPASSVIWNVGEVGTPAGSLNTGANDRVYVDFSIVTAPSGDQLVVFADYVHKSDGPAGLNLIDKPHLVLETGCLVLDPDTSQPVRYTRTMPLGGRAPTEWAVREDVQIGVVGTYDQLNKLTGHTLFNAKDVENRSQHYLDGMARKYRVTGGGQKTLVGIWPVDPDGSVQQVEWSVGAGATTVVGVNTEPSPVVPPYPARRLKENLPPDAAAALANKKEFDAYINRLPRPGGTVK